MQGNTHNMVGIACALGAAEIASLGNASPETMILAAAAGSFGGLIPDIDIKHSQARKQLYKVITTLICTIACLSIFESIFNVKWLSRLTMHTNNTRMIIGGIFVLGIYLYGMTTAHRSFMHSITVLIASTLCVFITLPSLAPYYAIGYASHLFIDLFNHKKEQLLWPSDKGNLCFDLCDANGIANYMICGIATIINVIIIYIYFS